MLCELLERVGQEVQSIAGTAVRLERERRKDEVEEGDGSAAVVVVGGAKEAKGAAQARAQGCNMSTRALNVIVSKGSASLCEEQRVLRKAKSRVPKVAEAVLLATGDPLREEPSPLAQEDCNGVVREVLECLLDTVVVSPAAAPSVYLEGDLGANIVSGEAVRRKQCRTPTPRAENDTRSCKTRSRGIVGSRGEDLGEDHVRTEHQANGRAKGESAHLVSG